jgi:integrase
MQVISEGPVRITRATIEAAWRRREPDQRLILRDRDCRGLALIINPTTMTWSFAYRPRGTNPLTGQRWPNRAVTLGNPSSLPPDDARAQANTIKGQAAAGADPAAEKKMEAEATRRRRAVTLARLAETYLHSLPKRPKMRGSGAPSPAYVAEEIAQLRMALAAMAAETMPATALTDREVRTLLDEAGGNTVARKRFGALSRFLDWCHDAGHIQTNPCALIARARRPRAPQARTHYLTLPELARLWEAAGRLREPVWRDFARFLIAVPCRRGEAARLDWSHIDLAAAEWRQPGHMTKNRDSHRLHLHALALEVLGERRKVVGGKGLVFPAPLAGGVLTAFSGIKIALGKAIDSGTIDYDAGPLAVWSFHDHRRSFATALGEAGILETIADGILNHRQSATRGGVLGVYQRSSRWPEQVRAMELWGRLLTEALTGKADAKVVAMLAARAG